MKQPQIDSPLILTVDIGSSSTRAMLFDGQARPVEGCGTQVSYRMQTTPDGGAEFNPNTLFEAVIQAIDQLLDQAGSLAGQIEAVALDTLVTNIMGLDASGVPISPLYTYADTRNAADTQALRCELGEQGLKLTHNRTGCLLHSAYLPPRFHWIARTRPEQLQTASRWASIGEYLFWRLFGQWRVTYSVAAWSGLLNRRLLCWDNPWLLNLSLDEKQLSTLVDVNEPSTGLLGEWANRWPALKDVPWFPPIGDGAAANIGSGCHDPSRLALTIGTSGAMRVVLPPSLPEVPDGLWLYRVDRQRGLLGGATTEGGNLFAWFRETLHLPNPDALETALAAMPPAAHGLTVLPFVAGERAPGWHDDARASLIGFTLNTRPLDIVRAGLESIAYRFALIYGLIAPHLPAQENPQIIASGGIVNSPAWLQIMADVLGQPVQTLAEKEATSRGIALLALESLGVIPNPAALPPALGQTFEPRADHHACYQAALETQRQYYKQLVGH